LICGLSDRLLTVEHPSTQPAISSPVDTPAIGHVVSGQVVRVVLLPEAALHHPPRTRDGGAIAFPGVEPTGILGLQRRGRRETLAGSADAEPAIPGKATDAFLHLVTVSVCLYYSY